VHLLETFIRNLIEDARYRKPQVSNNSDFVCEGAGGTYDISHSEWVVCLSVI
jgi:hypothetical protein